MRVKSISNKGLAVLKFNYSLELSNQTHINDTLFDIYVEQIKNKEESQIPINDTLLDV